MNEMPVPPCSNRSVIAAYFAGHGSPFADASVRAHVDDCASCRCYYERELLLSTLDPQAPKAKERIARGLGLRAARRPRLRRASWMAGGGLIAATAALLLLARPREAPHPNAVGTVGAFTARGVASDHQAPAVWIYRVARDGRISLAEQTLGAEDELAFAYSNTARHPYLMIFGVDEHRHVYWYHPAWPAETPPPASVPTTAGPGPHELSEAVRHHTDGARLTIYTLLSQRRMGVDAVEDAVRGAASNHTVASAIEGDGTVVLRRSFEVGR
jgi:hypothetical protein